LTAALLAPAKVNLFLHVGAAGADGYHALVSLMTFADLGDRLSFEASDNQVLTVEGMFGAGLSDGPGNLVWQAAQALLHAAGRPDSGFHLILDKRLPLAAGLGGGSSDAGAALRLLNTALDLGQDDAALLALAAGLGADGAACLHGRPVLAQGRGERLSPAPAWPDLPCVLVNPGAASATGAVYRAFDEAGAFGDITPPDLAALSSVTEVAAVLAGLRNDLEAPAIALEPRIGAVLATLRSAPEVLLARMSGSGGTCFALCPDMGAAQGLAARLFVDQPAWWARPCRLGGAS
jgi:4-diphosphocytidyl-2-C-methyl-D-erythritol kinase